MLRFFIAYEINLPISIHNRKHVQAMIRMIWSTMGKGKKGRETGKERKARMKDLFSRILQSVEKLQHHQHPKQICSGDKPAFCETDVAGLFS